MGKYMTRVHGNLSLVHQDPLLRTQTLRLSQKLFGTPTGNRTQINQLSVATGYKSAVLPLNYRGIPLIVLSRYG